jgi:small multidrug resistance pump
MTPAVTWLLLLLAIGCEVVGTSLLPASDRFTRPLPSVLVLLAYALAFYLLSVVVRTMPVGIVYAIWAGLGIVLVSAVGWVVYRQHLDVPALIGLAMIIGGVVVVNVFSTSVRH